MTATVITLGDLVVDQVLTVDSFPVLPDAHQRVSQVVISPGGAANTLIVGARLGLPMQAIGCIGDDFAGRIVIEGLRGERIDTRLIDVVAGEATTMVYTLVDAEGRHVFLGRSGARGHAHLPPPWKKAIETARLLFFDGWTYRAEQPALFLEAARLAHKARIPVFFDPGPEYPHFDPAWLEAVLACTRVLLITHDELRGLFAQPDAPLETVGRLAIERGVELVVIKQGAGGCTLVTASRVVSHPGFPVTVRDTAGAGDSVAAAVMLAYLEKMPLDEIAALANAAGAAAVQVLGTGFNLPGREAIFGMLT
ncbi:MAG: carbohydrate kinase family protein [bacterium]|nr:carbohydrate kinase family protein [bacterium]